MKLHPLVLAAAIVDLAIPAVLIAGFLTRGSIGLIMLSIPLFLVGLVLGMIAIGKEAIPRPQKAIAILGPFLLPGMAWGVYQGSRVLGLLG